MEYVTRKLKKMLDLAPDEIYHVFCLALCVGYADGKITEREGEVLTRLGFGLGLSPEDNQALTKNALEAVQETSVSDVIAYSLTRLKEKLDPDQLAGVRQILHYVAGSDRKLPDAETDLLKLVDETWGI